MGQALFEQEYFCRFLLGDRQVFSLGAIDSVVRGAAEREEALGWKLCGDLYQPAACGYSVYMLERRLRRKRDRSRLRDRWCDTLASGRPGSVATPTQRPYGIDVTSRERAA